MTDNNVQPGSSQALPDGAIPAATLVIMRPCESGGADEILMVKRSRTMAFAAGAVVFLGGRIGPDDYRVAAEHCFAPAAAEASAPVRAIGRTAWKGKMCQVVVGLGVAVPVKKKKITIKTLE